jgi:hypothetical protein
MHPTNWAAVRTGAVVSAGPTSTTTTTTAATVTTTEDDDAAKEAFLATLSDLQRRVFLAIERRLTQLSGRGVIRLELQHTPPAALLGVSSALQRTALVQELQITGREFPQLPSVISANPRIHSLVVDREACGNATDILLASLAAPSFRCLGFQTCQATSASARIIEAAIEALGNSLGNPQLRGLEKFAVGDKHVLLTPEVLSSLVPVNIMPLMKALALPVKMQTQLTGLSFAGLVVEDPHLTSVALASALQAPECRLRHLELFVDHDAREIANALCLNSSLAYVQWDCADIEPLVEALKVNVTVTVLDLLRCSRAAILGSRLFTDAIAEFTGVRALRMPLELLHDEELISLGKSLQRNRSLRNITIRKVNSAPLFFEDGAIRSFATSLGDAAGIEKVEFSSACLKTSFPLADVELLSGGLFHMQGSVDAATVIERKFPTGDEHHTIVSVLHCSREEKFKIPRVFTMTNLLNWACERFGMGISRLALLRRDNNLRIFNEGASHEDSKRTMREQFGVEDPINLHLLRGDRAAVVFAWHLLGTREVSVGSRKRVASPVCVPAHEDKRARSDSGTIVSKNSSGGSQNNPRFGELPLDVVRIVKEFIFPSQFSTGKPPALPSISNGAPQQF